MTEMVNIMLRRHGASLTAIVLATVAAMGCEANNKSGQMETAAASRSTFVGRRAPEFALANEHNQLVRLGDLRGRWVVLYFYPADDTPGCACQATEFTHLLTTFRDLNATVLGVSGDSPASHRRFIAKYDLGISLLSDPAHEAMSAYGAWVRTRMADQWLGRAIRSTVIVDPAGRVRYHWPEVIPQGHAARVHAKLAELQSAANQPCGCGS